MLHAELPYPDADGMNGILAELALQFSQQGALPLLEVVAHGRLKHLDGGNSLDDGKQVGSMPSPSRGSLDRMSPSRDSAVWRFRVSLVEGGTWNQSASACLTSCSSRERYSYRGGEALGSGRSLSGM